MTETGANSSLRNINVARLRRLSDIHSIYGLFIRRYRPKRMRFVAEYFALNEKTRVLDVGGTMTNWDFLPFRPHLTILNIGKIKPDGLPDDVRYVRGDACDMPFGNDAFDLVFSNSVIEHVGAWDRQVSMAREVQRVGRACYVQTPNFWFPVEPHFLTPLIHWLPRAIRKALVRNFTVWGWFTRPTKARADSFVDNTRLLKWREMAALFPEADLVGESSLLLTKSIIAARRERHE